MNRLRRRRLVAVICAIGLVAAACGDDDDGAAPPATTAAPTTTAGDTTTTAPDGDGDFGEVYEDPRGGIYAEFQQTVDRSSRFSQLDAFCHAGDPPSEEPQASDRGITPETISVVHLRTRLEELEGIGFAIPVGNVRDIFETFVRIANERCGGVNGRTIELHLVEVSALGGGGQDIDALRNAACIEATEDRQAVFVLNTSGFQGSAIRCLTEAHDSIFISTQSVSRADVDAAGNRLYSMSFTSEDSLAVMARAVAEAGLLDGKTIGVVAPDTPTQPESMEDGLIAVLRDEFGIEVARYDIIGCGGTSTCNEGIPASVQGMIRDGVDVLFPGLNVVSLPLYIDEMDVQGVEPGQIQIINSNFNSQSGDLVSGKVVEFGGEGAGRLYDGTIIISEAETGAYRTEGFQPRPFNEMCNREYQEHSTLPAEEKTFAADDEETVSPYGMVTSVCTQVRIMLRALEAAGVNPTRAQLASAVENLGSIDRGDMFPSSFRPGKYTAPDSVAVLRFNYPCPGGTLFASGACVIQTEPSRLID